MNFEKYKEYCSEDFVTDLYFTQWILTPENLTVTYFWENFLEKYPNKIHEIELARYKMLEPNSSLNNCFSQEEIESLWHHINVSITTN